MNQFLLDESHMIQVTEEHGNYRVKFFEHYESCGWRYLSSDLYDKESLEWEYGITL